MQQQEDVNVVFEELHEVHHPTGSSLQIRAPVQLLRRCLAKGPMDRLASAKELRP